MFNPCLGQRIDRCLHIHTIHFNGQFATREKEAANSPMSFITGNIIVCGDATYEEQNAMFSASELLSVITVQPVVTHAYFYTLAFVFCGPGDLSEHVMSIRLMTLDGKNAGSAPDERFQNGYRIDKNGIGGYSLRTKWEVKMETLPYFGWFWVCVFVDGWLVARTPLMLRR